MIKTSFLVLFKKEINDSKEEFLNIKLKPMDFLEKIIPHTKDLMR